MAAGDGDSRNVVDTSHAQPWNRDDVRVESHAVAVSTDGSGDGSATVTWNERFDSGEVYVQVTAGSDGDCYVPSSGETQATVSIAGSSTTGGSVTVFVLAVGPEVV